MSKGFWRGMGVAVAIACGCASAARAEMVVGVDATAATPLSTYGRSVGLGGALGIWGAYGAEVTDWLWAGFMLEPQFTFFHGDARVSSKTTTMFSLTGGPRLTARWADIEAFVAGMGGLYTDVTGPFSDTGGGWNVGGGVSYYLVPGTSLGIFVRYDSAGLTAAPGSGANRTFLLGGLGVQHRFLEPPAPVPPATIGR